MWWPSLVDTPWSLFGLRDPIRVMAADGVVDVEHGHAVPCATDWNGDKKTDLLVGQYQGGTLRIYVDSSNGPNRSLKFLKMFDAGGTEAAVSYG